jgi:4a-hydroxytetrahydrobiopterin dehydratase
MDASTGGSDWISAAEFHRAAGVADWRVTGTGPQAVFTATSLARAAELVVPVVAASERFGILPDVDLRPEGVVVRVPYRVDGIPAAAAPFAAAVSQAAADLHLTPDPSLAQSVGIYVAQHSEADVRPFFTTALGYEEFGDTDAVDPLRCGPQLAFNPISGDASGRGRTHLDVFVPADQARARVDAALAAGGRGLGPRTLLTAASDRLTVKLTREMWGTERQHVDLARAISAIAREYGAVADKSAAQEIQVAIAAKPQAIDLPFWRAVLGYSPLHEDNCIDPLGQGSTVWMQDIDPSKSLNHAMHIDVSLAREHIQARLDAAVTAGGRIVDDAEAPSAWILADRSGNKVCLAAWPDGAQPAGANEDAAQSQV